MLSMNTFQVMKTETVLFDFNKDTLTDDGKAQLDELAHQAAGMDRYVIEFKDSPTRPGLQLITRL
jgi:outer membrane protein OmpA-like peptidoglycan-associated protein